MGAQEEPPTATVLEELFFALMGHTGDVFVNTGPAASPAAIMVSKDLAFIAQADKEILNELLELGHHFRCMEAFVQQEEFSWSRGGGSQYRCALANGIRELLHVYADSILKLQQRLESTAQPSLATVNYYLAEYKVLLPAIHHLVQQVLQGDWKGGAVLALLHRKVRCGVPELQSCLSRLQWHCHRTLLKQLQAWMVHGLLEDDSQEFFIRRCAPGEAQPPAERDAAGQESDAVFDWHKSFEVRSDCLPPEVPADVADSVLFIGKSVRVLQPARAVWIEDPLGAAPALQRLEEMPAFDASQLALEVEAARGQAAKKLWQLAVVEGELLQHLGALRDYFLLGRGDFWQGFLLETRSLMGWPPVRATAIRDLHTAMQQSASMSSAEGDPRFARLRLSFPSPSADAAPGTSQTRPSTLGPYSSTGARLTTPALPTVTRFSGSTGLTLPGAFSDVISPKVTPQTGDPRAGKGKRSLKVPEYDPHWDSLALDYKVQWPLHLILSAEAMMKYSRMFQYLFRLRRLQLALHLSWAAAKGSRGQGCWQAPRGQPPLWQVRNHMAHFVDNLQLYIQVDVIEVQHRKLTAALAELEDLSAATRAHDAFLAACIVQSCLDVPMFSMLLSRLMASCKSLCSHLQALEVGGRDELLPYPTKLVDDFVRNSRLLYKLLSTPSMQSRARAPFLRQLLLRLNFNDYVQHDTDRHAFAPGAPAAAGSAS